MEWPVEPKPPRDVVDVDRDATPGRLALVRAVVVDDERAPHDPHSQEECEEERLDEPLDHERLRGPHGLAGVGPGGTPGATRDEIPDAAPGVGGTPVPAAAGGVSQRSLGIMA